MKPPALCSTCAYFRPLGDDSNGVCHHAPPNPSLVDEDEDSVNVAWGVWPIVEPTDFCSEWRPVRIALATRLRIAADRLSRPAPVKRQKVHR